MSVEEPRALARGGRDVRVSELEAAVQRVVAGDTAAFGELVEATTPRLYRLAARMMGNEADAQDLLQVAFVRAFDALVDGRFDGRSDVETWLYRIVTNTAIDALRARRRKRRHMTEVADDVPIEDPIDADDRLAARAALREIASFLDELPADQRTAIVLKELEGLSTNEVARTMGCSVGAVEQRLVRARATLRRRSEG